MSDERERELSSAWREKERIPFVDWRASSKVRDERANKFPAATQWQATAEAAAPRVRSIQLGSFQRGLKTGSFLAQTD